MNDVFFSYSSKDRPQVRPIVDALIESGFSVFWDQKVPIGSDWDSHIRVNLAAAKCVVVVWTVNSIASDNVRHEAMLAKQQNKLIPILLGVRPEGLPMGFYTIQTVDLATWTGKADDPTLVKLATEIAARTGRVLPDTKHNGAPIRKRLPRDRRQAQRSAALPPDVEGKPKRRDESARKKDEVRAQGSARKGLRATAPSVAREVTAEEDERRCREKERREKEEEEAHEKRIDAQVAQARKRPVDPRADRDFFVTTALGVVGFILFIAFVIWMIYMWFQTPSFIGVQ